jgi:Domain of unknown function (DUF4440)
LRSIWYGGSCRLVGQCNVFIRHREQLAMPPVSLDLDDAGVERLSALISRWALAGLAQANANVSGHWRTHQLRRADRYQHGKSTKGRRCDRRIKALEDRPYHAMLAGDIAVLNELCSDDLIYTHSKADYDDKRSYLHKVETRYFTYFEITHPADRILVVDGAALVTGRMTAKVSVTGTIVHVDNRYLAVWVRERGAWKFVAYQPTPIINSWHRALLRRAGRPVSALLALPHSDNGVLNGASVIAFGLLQISKFH